jgi:hypothetical protein
MKFVELLIVKPSRFERRIAAIEQPRLLSGVNGFCMKSCMVTALLVLSGCSSLVSVPALPQVVSVYSKPEHATEGSFGAVPIGFVPVGKEMEVVPCPALFPVNSKLVCVKTSTGSVGWINRDHM